jgi:hypothetical protein
MRADAFLPVTPQGHVLLTTRASVGGSIAHLLTVEQLDKEESIYPLLRRSRILSADASLEQVSTKDRAEAEAIVNELGRLPLALDQTGAYLEETGSL